ncbi:MAG: hypothetical protein AB7K09_04925 [Planctomycetota bacterium]
MQAGSLHHNQMQAGSLHHNQMQAGSLHHNQMQAGSLHHNQMQAGSLHHNQMQAGSRHHNHMQAGSLHHNRLQAGSLHHIYCRLEACGGLARRIGFVPSISTSTYRATARVAKLPFCQSGRPFFRGHGLESPYSSASKS